MNTARILMNTVTFILLFSTTVCGLYLRFQKGKIPDYNSSVNFHMTIALFTVAAVIASLALARR